jgi:hypothetical protein
VDLNGNLKKIIMFKPRDYQNEISDQANDILNKLGIVYLSLEVRTGKTFTSFLTAEKYGAKNVLFVTKKKAIGSIQSDYEMMNPTFEICIINFESVHKIDFTPDFVVIDEGHSLGQYPKASNRTKAIKEIVKGLPLILMSGTPSPESYSQLYHQFWISENSPFKKYTNFYKWAKLFTNEKKRYVYNREMNDYSDARIDEIKKATSEYFISFTQKQAGFNKKVTEYILTCDMSPNLGKLIDRINKDLVYEMKDGNLILADTAVKLQNKIHQISSGTVKDEDGNYHILDNSKAEFIKNHFKGQKIAIFYKFKAELELLKQTFTNYTDSPEEFQESANMTFLGQFQSAREGIRLDTAESLVFYNIDFSFLSYEQGKNRIISKERETEAPLYFVFNREGIEPKIYKQVLNKQDYTLSYYLKDYGIKRDLFRKQDSK